MINGKKDIISMNDFTAEEILFILKKAEAIEKMSDEEKLLQMHGKIVATMFYEPSTRTKLSFESAAMRLGANILYFDTEHSSVKKGESFSDTIRMVESYSDIIVIRHPMDGAARLAASVSHKPVLNGGDGSNQHPSQTLLDLYTIMKEKGTLENIHIAFTGDLKYGRTVHSLVKALKHFHPVIYFVSPPNLAMPQYLLDDLDDAGVTYYIEENFTDCLDKLDVFYMTRIQRERFPDPEEYEKVKGVYIINRGNIEGKCKDDMIILHPLPRVNEIDVDLDTTKYARYFEQARNGIPIRQAMMMLSLER
ncbi:aspartate carbamoyltransferase [Treponema sp. OMZ 305]|uniref:aspartate carbamoyltransferase n=1 Tax=Treponema TaxID=157 RepID=UPI001BAFBB64|nr:MULTISPECIES: aspartate carbamoyltransferase [Treponema]QUY17539.1 aspartate carbamoyltransferase [Treponema vincentii]UTC57408.1 aspartate carbamoyltransferase [Treponema sp. OMZ 305]